MTEIELTELRATLDKLAKEKDPAILSNDGAKYANAVMSTMYNNAIKEMRIFASNMDGSISECEGCGEEYLNSLKHYIKSPNAKLSILIEEYPSEPKGVYNFLISYISDSSKINNNIDFRIIENKELLKEFDKLNPNPELGKNIHFATVDRDMFRIEYDAQKHNALFSFKNKTVTDKLNTAFDEVFKQCKSVKTLQ